MKIEARRLFTYPVLAEGRDDYKTCKFFAKAQPHPTADAANNLVFDIDLSTDCSEINQLISNGDAEYLFHVECPTTIYREIFNSVVGKFSCKIPLNLLKDKLYFVCFIVLRRDVPDFELAPLDAGLDVGEIDFRNSKILYKNLNFLTPRQAADERFWAGFCHGAFYDYVRRRWSYDKINNLSGVDKGETIKRILNRFFFDGGSREKLLTNTLSKYWWTGHIFSREALDILGSKDFYTKLFSIVSRSFIGNEKLRNGFVKFLRHFKARGATLEIDKHIRPAMSELNRHGGAIVLDCLTEADIAAIMIEHVEKILQR